MYIVIIKDKYQEDKVYENILWHPAKRGLWKFDSLEKVENIVSEMGLTEDEYDIYKIVPEGDAPSN